MVVGADLRGDAHGGFQSPFDKERTGCNRCRKCVLLHAGEGVLGEELNEIVDVGAVRPCDDVGPKESIVGFELHDEVRVVLMLADAGGAALDLAPALANQDAMVTSNAWDGGVDIMRRPPVSRSEFETQ